MAMAEHPEASIPQQGQSWAQTIGTYRFLHNERVTLDALQSGAMAQVRQACADANVTLMLHDLTELKPVHTLSETKLLQHTTLAVAGEPGGEIFGVMHQRWFDDPKAPPGESRQQRHQRWTRSQVWAEAVDAVAEPAGEGRWIHVADREADDFQMFQACGRNGQGFVIRSQHDRYLEDGIRLRQAMAQQPVAGGLIVFVPRRGAVGEEAPPRRRRAAQPGRLARCEVRTARLTLAPPRNDPRYDQPQPVWAVHVQELDPPEDVTRPLDWLLLSSEPVTCLADAVTVIGWYQRRWLIEEFHKAQKTGCRLEQSQLADRDAFCRLAAITGPIAARLLQLRQQADDDATAHTPAAEHIDDPLWVQVVSHLARHDDPATLTVRQFWHTIARRGGWLGRKHDGRPGWQTLWKGFWEIAILVEGARLAQHLPRTPRTCV